MSSDLSSTAVKGTPSLRSVVVMVEPVNFFCNEATCEDNYFQQKEEVGAGDAASGGGSATSGPSSGSLALAEHRGVYDALVRRGIATSLYRLKEEAGLGEVPAGELLSPEAQQAMLAGKPDAIFPNNSISFHELSSTAREGIAAAAASSSFSTPLSGLAFVLYPMCPGRRNEIPRSLLNKVKRDAGLIITPRFVGEGALTDPSSWSLAYASQEGGGGSAVLIDLRAFEGLAALAGSAAATVDGHGGTGAWWALEGTGSLNFSADCSSVFATASQRCHPIPFHLLCEALGIARSQRFLVPCAVDAEGRCIYHTNVVGWVGDGGLAAWCREGLRFGSEAWVGHSTTLGGAFAELFTSEAAFDGVLAAAYPKHFTLAYAHLVGFAGNTMFLRSRDGVAYLAMSATAASALGDGLLSSMNAALATASFSTLSQGGCIEDAPVRLYPQFPHIIACPIPTIERLGGGSVRCLLAASMALTDEGYGRLSTFVSN